jgi:hypothetical protein
MIIIVSTYKGHKPAIEDQEQMLIQVLGYFETEIPGYRILTDVRLYRF